MDPRWRIELFGGLRAHLGEREIHRFRTQKTAALLAYLALFLSTAAQLMVPQMVQNILDSITQGMAAQQLAAMPPNAQQGPILVVEASAPHLAFDQPVPPAAVRGDWDVKVMGQHRPDTAMDADDFALHVEERTARIAADELAVGAEDALPSE